ncbi:MAG: alpha/beta hydrolase [Streptosporangiaceae bacterium]
MNVRTEQITFPSEGIDCAATLYLPADTPGALPGLVMGNGFANVRQMYLPVYARQFAAAGLVVLAIDYRYLGQSGGAPRQQVLPDAQCEDLRNALTWLTARPEVDAERIGLWGTSFAGGHALRIAAIDRRVTAVVAQVPAIGLWRYMRRNDPLERERFLARALTARLDYARTGEARPLAITAQEGAESILGSAGLDWHHRNEHDHDTFHNWIAAHSLDRIVPYDPGAFVEDISPTPLLMILVDNDTTTPSDVARQIYNRTREPKQLIELAGGHYDVYDQPATRQACIAATTTFLAEHLSTPAMLRVRQMGGPAMQRPHIHDARSEP